MVVTGRGEKRKSEDWQRTIPDFNLDLFTISLATFSPRQEITMSVAYNRRKRAGKKKTGTI